jgi:Family of unknown function (DUF6209)
MRRLPSVAVVFAVAVVFTAAVAGCGGLPPPATAEAVAADSAPTPLLVFAADWSVTQSAPVVAGGKAIVRYDIARLPHCRAWYHGFPAWSIIASWAVDGGYAYTQPVVARDASGQMVGVDLPIDVPPGRDLALWFHASDEYGCSEWDSRWGANFHFALADGPPAVHFRWPGWGVEELPQLRAGQDFLVDYDIRRLPSCRQDYNGYQTWDVTVGYRFDDGTSGSASLTAAPQGYQRVPAPARLTAPAGAQAVELWFESHDRTGCQQWDSAYGANYKFSLEQ